VENKQYILHKDSYKFAFQNYLNNNFQIIVNAKKILLKFTFWKTTNFSLQNYKYLKILIINVILSTYILYL